MTFQPEPPTERCPEPRIGFGEPGDHRAGEQRRERRASGAAAKRVEQDDRGPDGFAYRIDDSRVV